MALVRYLPEEQLASTENPQPIILDTHLRFPLSARLLQQALAYRDPAGGGKAQRRPAPRMPWIFASHAAHDPQRKQQLEGLGTTIVLVPHEYCDTRTHNPLLQFVLGYLGQRGIRRLMVEGGPTIIGSLFAPQRPFPAGRPPVDLCVVTVSPSWVGPAGKHIPLPSQPAARSSLPRLSDPVYQQFGPDIVVLGRPNL
ncbi:GTP cyclohydrolase II [Spiromyces aspiralis]|uniref:GTP cyclohydrolase II n=1 Tax=Spiromyces aspiralis TaxID=68401 RepID=A0ACC1HE51_9FUNG|nr:GTP cyclohydrolase II [Spiromyces aspiralis]